MRDASREKLLAASRPEINVVAALVAARYENRTEVLFSLPKTLDFALFICILVLEQIFRTYFQILMVLTRRGRY